MPRPKVVVVKNKDGTSSSERTISVSHSALNKGRETLIPTLVEGRQLSPDEAVQHAVKSGLQYPSFNSPKEAEAFAAQRSKTGGATKHGFLGKERKMPKKETTAEFQKRTFPAKAAKVIREADKVIASRGIGKAKRAKAEKAKKAAERVQGRLGVKGGKAPSRKEVTKPDKAAQRRKPFERGTGTDKIRTRLEGVNELVKAGRK